MDLLLENLNESEGSFYEKLHQEGYFDNSLFAELIIYIDGLNSRQLSEIQRLRYCSQIWELAYRMQSSIGYNHNQNDVFQISNIEDEKLIEIGQVLEYISKSFTENRMLDMDFINEII